jgi:diguanylate cyclase (GGDEF)-like protein/PAS domain S-box-containing protein
MNKVLTNKNNGIVQNSGNSHTISFEIVELLFKGTNMAVIAAFIVATILLSMLSGAITFKAAIVWITLMLVAYGHKLYLVAQFQKSNASALDATKWLKRFDISTLLCGLAWGSASLIIFPQNNTVLQAILALVLAGVCAGSLIGYSIRTSAALSFVGAVAIFSVPAFLIEDGPYTGKIILIAGFFVLFVAPSSKSLAQGLLDNMALRINAENQKKEISNLSLRQNLHMEHTPMGVIEWDSNLAITSWNKACSDIFGYSNMEIIGKHISFLMPDLMGNSTHEIIPLLLNQDANPINLKKIAHKSGEAIFCEWFNTALKNNDGEIVGLATLVQDKTVFIKTQNKIHQLAYYDALTKLPNRGLLLDRLNQAITISERSQTFGMVVYIDLDHFKTINDTKGHAAGDYFLKAISNQLQKAVRKQDTVARMGGDEFVLVLADIGKSDKEAHAFGQQIIEKIIQAIKIPVTYDGFQHQCSASTGICLFKGNAIDADELLRRADMSMYLSKKQGRNNHQYYDESIQPQYEYQLELKNDLSKALAGNQFQLYLQGQYNKDYKAVGAEVLLRWQHPKHGLVLPSDFIHLVEESGLIVSVGSWIIHEACVQLKQWEASPLTNKLTLSVNVSAVQFNHINFISDIESAIKLSGCDATRLCIELTESAVINSIEDIVYKMNYLNSMGISLSIDDFGIGYSSLFMLKRLPINELKIDKNFVQDITKGNVDGTLAQTILQMGKNLKLGIVAEGVETEYQMEYLRSHGCKVFQGYLFQKPCNISEFEKALTLSKAAANVNSTILINAPKYTRKTIANIESNRA